MDRKLYTRHFLRSAIVSYFLSNHPMQTGSADLMRKNIETLIAIRRRVDNLGDPQSAPALGERKSGRKRYVLGEITLFSAVIAVVNGESAGPSPFFISCEGNACRRTDSISFFMRFASPGRPWRTHEHADGTSVSEREREFNQI